MTAPLEKSIDPTQYGVVYSEGTSAVCDLYHRARLASDAGDIPLARALYEQALSHEPFNAQGHIGLASCAMGEKNFELARRCFGRALELDPTSASAHVGLGSVHYLVKRFEESVAHYEQALRLCADLPDAHWGAAAALEALGDKGPMRAHAKRFLELAPESTLAPRARRMLRTGLFSFL